MATNPRRWRDDEVALVRRVAQTVASLIDREQVGASLRRNRARLAALLDGSHDVVVVIDDQGEIGYANKAVRRALGLDPEEMVGRNMVEFVDRDDLDLALRRLTDLRDGIPTPLTVVKVRAADGSLRCLEISSGDVREPSGGGRVLTCRDVTDRMVEAAAATRWVELLEFAFDVAQMALDVDPAQFIEQLPSICQRIAALLDVDVAYVDQLDETRRVLINIGGWVRDRSRSSVHQGVAISFTEIPLWLERMRMNTPIVVEHASEFTEPWAEEKCRVLGSGGGAMSIPMSSAGELVGVVGVSMAQSRRSWTDDEVTFLRIVTETVAHVLDRARLDEALRSSEARFRLLSETAADLVILVGLDGLFKYVSPSSEALAGIAPSELIGTPAEAMIHPDDRARARANVPRIIEHGWLLAEMRIRHRDGSWIWVANSTSVVRDPLTGQVTEFRASLRDISDRKRLEAELERQALHDHLTGLANRVLLQRKLEIAVTSGDPFGHVSVLLLDLDGFKDVNDTHGHSLGDEVLRIVAARLRRIARSTDTLARTGGDEFVLLCPRTDEGHAVRIAQRMVDAIRTPVSVGEVTVQLGASVGVAYQDGYFCDADALMLEADRAMYAAKRAGRCKVGLAPGRIVG
jgi:diguanylate cyclase (GGDEF)-like protein/PAS domain S-box-containing protein